MTKNTAKNGTTKKKQNGVAEKMSAKKMSKARVRTGITAGDGSVSWDHGSGI